MGEVIANKYCTLVNIQKCPYICIYYSVNKMTFVQKHKTVKKPPIKFEQSFLKNNRNNGLIIRIDSDYFFLMLDQLKNLSVHITTTNVNIMNIYHYRNQGVVNVKTAYNNSLSN